MKLLFPASLLKVVKLALEIQKLKLYLFYPWCGVQTNYIRSFVCGLIVRILSFYLSWKDVMVCF